MDFKKINEHMYIEAVYMYIDVYRAWYIEIIIVIMHQTVFAMSKRPILSCRIGLFYDLF